MHDPQAGGGKKSLSGFFGRLSPTIDKFVHNALGSVTWPGGIGFKLSTLALDECLQLGVAIDGTPTP